MATAPTVQTLAQVMADLNPAYGAQKTAIDANSAQLQTQGDATVKGLQAQRGEAWNDIGTSANARGFAFSGIPIDEQARYDSTKFMPAVANVGQEVLKGVNANNLQKASLDTEATRYGLSRIDQQQSSLNQWNLSQMQQEAQARENALNRQASAAEAAANRAAQAQADVAPNRDQWLMSTFESLANAAAGQNQNWLKNSSTENATVAGRLASQFGMSNEQARQYVYSKRRDWYGS